MNDEEEVGPIRGITAGLGALCVFHVCTLLGLTVQGEGLRGFRVEASFQVCKSQDFSVCSFRRRLVVGLVVELVWGSFQNLYWPIFSASFENPCRLY